jgi:ABC-type sugar transport system ATPase subunit
MARMELSSLAKRYGQVEVLREIDLTIEDGEFVVLVGPSGCGKSTLLRMIAGLEPISGGELRIDGRRVNETAPRDRDIAMVFQSYALYPHMDVARNMGFSLEIRGKPEAERRPRVAAAASTLSLEPLLARLPKALSGGQRQRVAMGRAIVRQPRAFLFDEPLSNLDAALRVDMRLEIARLHKRLAATMIYVTHDQVEAMTLADRIVVLNGGDVQQVGSPLELYDRPANRFVAQFIGSPTMNILPVTLDDRGLPRLATGAAVPLDGLAPEGVAGRIAEIGLRPEHLVPGAAEGALVSGTADLVEHLGSDTNVYVRTQDYGTLVLRVHGHHPVRSDDALHLHARPGTVHAFDRDGLALPRRSR